MRQLCDIEMLLNGAFSPLEGFLGEADYRRVLSDMRLTSGVLWPMPITLDVTEKFAEKLKVGDTIALRDGEGVLTATMEISSIYRPDFDVEAKAVFGTTDQKHPAVSYLEDAQQPRLSRRQAARSRCPCVITISSTCAILLRSCAIAFRSSAGAGSWRSRRAIRCTARTRSSRSARRRTSKRTC